jgi:DNA-directed RNA polymerase subunit RPC12/RpoP
MYYCEECGAEFENPATYEETIGEFWGFPARETFYVCPECGSDMYDDEREREDGR